MASIRKEVRLESSAQQVWAALRDVGALHIMDINDADLLPHELADTIGTMIDHGLAAMKRAFASTASAG